MTKTIFQLISVSYDFKDRPTKCEKQRKYFEIE